MDPQLTMLAWLERRMNASLSRQIAARAAWRPATIDRAADMLGGVHPAGRQAAAPRVVGPRRSGAALFWWRRRAPASVLLGRQRRAVLATTSTRFNPLLAAPERDLITRPVPLEVEQPAAARPAALGGAFSGAVRLWQRVRGERPVERADESPPAVRRPLEATSEPLGAPAGLDELIDFDEGSGSVLELIAPLAAAVAGRARCAEAHRLETPARHATSQPAPDPAVWWSPQQGATPAEQSADAAVEPLADEDAPEWAFSSQDQPPLPSPAVLAQIVAEFESQRAAAQAPPVRSTSEPFVPPPVIRDGQVIETVGPATRRRRLSAFPPRAAGANAEPATPDTTARSVESSAADEPSAPTQATGAPALEDADVRVTASGAGAGPTEHTPRPASDDQPGGALPGQAEPARQTNLPDDSADAVQDRLPDESPDVDQTNLADDAVDAAQARLSDRATVADQANLAAALAGRAGVTLADAAAELAPSRVVDAVAPPTAEQSAEESRGADRVRESEPSWQSGPADTPGHLSVPADPAVPAPTSLADDASRTSPPARPGPPSQTSLADASARDSLAEAPAQAGHRAASAGPLAPPQPDLAGQAANLLHPAAPAGRTDLPAAQPALAPRAAQAVSSESAGASAAFTEASLPGAASPAGQASVDERAGHAAPSVSSAPPAGARDMRVDVQPAASIDTGPPDAPTASPDAARNAVPPPVSLPERPWEADDAELAQVIFSLPPAMAEAAIAQGVLSRPSTTPPPTPDATPRSAAAESSPPAPASHWSTPDLVLAPPATTARPAGPASTDLVAAGFTWTAPGAPEDFGGGGPASAPAAAPSSLVQRAPLDRPAATEQPAQAEPSPAAAAGPHPPGASSDGADLDELAEEVFGRLRWRLLAERERTMGIGG